jgi:hypothetical protein
MASGVTPLAWTISMQLLPPCWLSGAVIQVHAIWRALKAVGAHDASNCD